MEFKLYLCDNIYKNIEWKNKSKVTPINEKKKIATATLSVPQDHSPSKILNNN